MRNNLENGSDNSTADVGYQQAGETTEESGSGECKSQDGRVYVTIAG